jgi:hypothetical protein
MVPAIFWLRNSCSSTTAERDLWPFRKIQKRVYEVNALFSISLLVASIVRWRQVPSVMETVLISHIVWTQVVICSTVAFAQFCDYTLNKAKLSWGSLLLCMAIGAAELLTTCMIEVPSRDIYEDLAVQCYAQQQFIDLTGYLPASENGKSAARWLLIGIAIGLIILALAMIYGKFLLKYIPAWLKKHGEIIFCVTIALVDVTGILGISAITQGVRRVLKSLSGDQLPENGWGYSQTTALLVWTPVLWTTLHEFFCQ